MPSFCLCLQAHQPYRLRPFSFFDIGNGHLYEDEEGSRAVLDNAADNCYLPVNALLLELIREHHGDFRLAFSLTGTLLEQLEKYRPDTLESFRRLVATGCVELLGGTYFHSLAFLFSAREFKEQVRLHREKISSLFDQHPLTFRYPELIYNNRLAELAAGMGYRAIMADGVDRVRDGQGVNLVYRPRGGQKIKLLLKNHPLSDDIALPLADARGAADPLKADKVAQELSEIRDVSQVVNLCLDYESLGLHQEREKGIFAFLRALPVMISQAGFSFRTPAEAVRDRAPAALLEIPCSTSRADQERAFTARLGNALQKDAIYTLYAMEAKVRRRKDPALLNIWRQLQTSDYFSSMRNGQLADGAEHNYFSNHESPYDVYINYMNILDDFSRRLTPSRPQASKNKSALSYGDRWEICPQSKTRRQVS